MAAKYNKQILKLTPQMEKHQIVASVCRLLARANVNMMWVANFSNIATSKPDVVSVIEYCEQWVTITGKESYGIGIKSGEESASEETQATDVSSPTGG